MSRNPRKPDVTKFGKALIQAIIAEPTATSFTLQFLSFRADDGKTMLEHLSAEDLEPLLKAKSSLKPDLVKALDAWAEVRSRQASFDAKWRLQAGEKRQQAAVFLEEAADLEAKAADYAAKRGRK